MSNVDDRQPGSAGPLQARQLLYQRAVSMPVEAMLIGNLHADAHPVEARFATAIGSAPVLNGDLRKLIIALFRNQSNATQATVQLPLIPTGSYKVRSVLTGNQLGTFENSDWTRGVAVEFAEGATVEVLELSRI